MISIKKKKSFPSTCSDESCTMKQEQVLRNEICSVNRIASPPDTFCLAGGLDHRKRFWSAPVPEVKFVVCGDEEELSRGMEC